MSEPDHSEIQGNRRRSFGIVPLFYVVSLMATGFALPVQGNVYIFTLQNLIVPSLIIVLWLIVFCFASMRRFWKLAMIPGLLVLGFIFVCLVGNNIQGIEGHSYSSSSDTLCEGRLDMVAAALSLYAETNGQLPPPYVEDSDGKLLHSWRVLILPYMEQNEIAQSFYLQYDFDEPWNGENNQALFDQFEYHWELGFGTFGSHTKYRLVTGPGTAFENGDGISVEKIVDGNERFVLIVEDPRQSIPWHQPDHISIEEAVSFFSTSDPDVLKGHHRESIYGVTYHGVHFCTLDGHYGMISAGNNPKKLRDLFTVNDGKFPTKLKRDEIFVPNKGTYAAFWVMAILSVLPLLPLSRMLYRDFAERARNVGRLTDE